MRRSSDLPKLIAVAGRKRSGKGTAAKWLMEQHGYELVKFAEPLKAMMRTFFRQWSLDEETIERLIEGDLKEVCLPLSQDMEGVPLALAKVKMGGKSTRHAMQTLGTEWRDMLSTTLWMDIAEVRIREHLDHGRRVVIDDLRFTHEVNKISELGGAMIKVTNARLPSSTETHASEQELDDSIFSCVVQNDGTFDEFHKRLGKQLYGIYPPEERVDTALAFRF